ncbi:hypothetical protein BDV96DRAFT_586998 [Lophiotrema nucula]|uniref:Uncharacterized protein n=1 Tax=Lophiotrema nucula TaxID=690887 RepID=A0A6A5YRF5_9PLEO|nr:hypothetical protein BDV96DRAFT_586998 [Lophiotrema nucula]
MLANARTSWTTSEQNLLTPCKSYRNRIRLFLSGQPRRYFLFHRFGQTAQRSLRTDDAQKRHVHLERVPEPSPELCRQHRVHAKRWQRRPLIYVFKRHQYQTAESLLSQA